MKKYLYPFLLILVTGCLNSSQEEYDDSGDIAFYEDFRLQQGVQQTSSGLLYRVVEPGEGESPEADQFSFVSYQGNSVDNTISFSTEEDLDIFLPGEMTTFRGLGEGIQLMTPGATYEFVLPSSLATGDGRVYFFELTLDSFLIDQNEFLTQNAQNEGVVETSSGLQYRVIQEGQGETPQATDQVTANYSGSYTNGYVFDASEGEPVQFTVNGVIQGFSEGLQLMTPGSTYELFVPTDLGYGNNPPAGILPGAVLVFEVELVEILN